MGKPLSPPLICEKCHRRRLHPVKDKGHRWCKQCRAEAHARLANPGADASALPMTADEKRLVRTVYGKYCKYDFDATLELLREIRSHEYVCRVFSCKNGRGMWTYWTTKKPKRYLKHRH